MRFGAVGHLFSEKIVVRRSRWFVGAAFATAIAACGYHAQVNQDIAPIVNFTVRPTTIQQGQTALATWITTNATSCTASGAWNGSQPTSNTVGATIGPIATAGTYTYGVSCANNGFITSATQTLTVGAVPAPTIGFRVTPGSVSPGGSAILSWSTANASSCIATGGTGSDGWSNEVPIQDAAGVSTGPIVIPGNYVYNLSCTGTGGSAEKSVVLSVTAAAPPAPPTVNLTAQQSLIQAGQSGILAWTSSNATACSATGGSGSDAWSGVQPNSSSGISTGPLASSGTYAYTLSCTGPGGTANASASITVATSSRTPAPAVSISITPGRITAGGTALLSWSSANVDTCSASGSWSGAKSTSGSNVNTGSLTTAAVYSYTLSCSGVGGSTSDTTMLTVTPPPASVATFVALPPTVMVGETTALLWSSTNATSCAASGGTSGDGWSGNEPTAGAGESVGPYDTAGTFTYTLVCTGAGGPGAPKSVTVTVTNPIPIAASITAFLALPSTVQVGGVAALAWTSNAATQCTAAGGTGLDGWNGPVGVAGAGVSTGTLTHVGSITYSLVCTGPGGPSAPSSAIVNVVVAPPTPVSIVAFAATPNVIQVGQSMALSWATAGADTCTAGDGTGSDGWNGNVATMSLGAPLGPFNAAGTVTYTLTCTGPGGISAPASVILNVNNAPPSAAQVTAFTALPPTVQAGQATSLSWSTTNATSCTASGGTGSDGWHGNVPISSSGTPVGPLANAGIDTYVLTCTGPGGSGGPDAIDVTVTPIPPAPASIVSLTAVPSTIQAGGSASLTWVTSGATGCTGTDGTGTDGWPGPQPVVSSGTSTGVINAAGSYVYTLTCTGPGGSSTPSSAALNVTNVPPPAATIASFYASPNTLQVGQNIALTWSSVGATFCTASGGTGADGWHGAIATSDSGMVLGPLNTAGMFMFTLTCTGPGGTSAPSSVAVNVNNAPPVPSILTFTAASPAVEAGQSTAVSWTTANATVCTGTGGTGSDGWIAQWGTASAGTPVGPLGSPGIVMFTLTCAGPGGTSNPATLNVSVTSAPPPATIAALSATPNSIQTGQAATLSWSSNNAMFCTGSGGTGSDGWAATLPTGSNGSSTGPILVAGNYVYTLTCTGAGGQSAPASATVTVTTASPPATIVQFTAAPLSLLTGQSTQFTWSSANSSSCSGGGGTGTDGWSASQPVSGSGLPIGPFNQAGTFTYTLRCTGPGGTSPPSSVIIAVSDVPLAPIIDSFTASPAALQTGHSTTLTWSTSNATACTASDGRSGDGWSGTTGPSSTGTTEGPFATAATVVYTLTCTGPGGTTAPRSVSVVVSATPRPPTVSLLIAGGTTAQIQPGQSTSFAWTTTDATVCSASGGTGSDGWAASRPITGNGVGIGPITTPGSYSYTLTCSGPGGSAQGTVTLTVIASGAADCNVGTPTTSMAGAGASVTGTVNGGTFGLLCLLCSVNDPGNVIDGHAGDFATMDVPLAVLGNTELLVTTPATFPAGRTVGFILANGNTLLSLSLLGGVTIETFAGGQLQEQATVGDLLTLNALGLLNYNPNAGFASFRTTKPFDSAAVIVGSAVSVLTVMNVYQACVTLQ